MVAEVPSDLCRVVIYVHQSHFFEFHYKFFSVFVFRLMLITVSYCGSEE